MDLEETRGLGFRALARKHQVADFLALVVRQLRLAARVASFLAGAFQTGAGALPDHLALELGEDADHLHHHAPGGRGRVDGLGQRTESGSGRVDLFHYGQKVFQRP